MMTPPEALPKRKRSPGSTPGGGTPRHLRFQKCPDSDRPRRQTVPLSSVVAARTTLWSARTSPLRNRGPGRLPRQRSVIVSNEPAMGCPHELL
jgi:hypothetical protein